MRPPRDRWPWPLAVLTWVLASPVIGVALFLVVAAFGRPVVDQAAFAVAVLVEVMK
jgi:hypothetical protein